jgi:seryl-tRNA synthetase
VLTNPEAASHLAYKTKLNELYIAAEKMNKTLEKTKKKIAALSKAIGFAQENQDALYKTVFSLQKEQHALASRINGSDAKGEVGEKDTPTLSFRISVASRGFYSNTYGPTVMQMESYDMAVALLNTLLPQVDALAAATAKAIQNGEASGLPLIID